MSFKKWDTSALEHRIRGPRCHRPQWKSAPLLRRRLEKWMLRHLYSENTQEATPTHRREKRGGPGAQSQRETGPKTSKRSLRNTFIKTEPGQGEGTGSTPPERRCAPRNNRQNLQLDNLKQSLLTEFYPKMNSVSEIRPGLGAQSESPNPQTAAQLSGEGTRVQNVLRDERNTQRAPRGSHTHYLRSNASAPALQDRTNLQNATPAPPPRKPGGGGNALRSRRTEPSEANQTRLDTKKETTRRRSARQPKTN